MPTNIPVESGFMQAATTTPLPSCIFHATFYSTFSRARYNIHSTSTSIHVERPVYTRMCGVLHERSNPESYAVNVPRDQQTRGTNGFRSDVYTRARRNLITRSNNSINPRDIPTNETRCNRVEYIYVNGNDSCFRYFPHDLLGINDNFVCRTMFWKRRLRGRVCSVRWWKKVSRDGRGARGVLRFGSIPTPRALLTTPHAYVVEMVKYSE